MIRTSGFSCAFVEMGDKKDDKSEEKTIAEDLVVTKYKMASEIVNRVLKLVIEKCVENASVKEICEYSDQLLFEDTSNCFKKIKDMKKGIAFPTCISVNNCICHYSPLKSDPDLILKREDVVKIDLGAHVDGFIAVVAHTIVVGAAKHRKCMGKKANAILAAHYASEAALRLMKKGNDTYLITDTVQKICKDFECKPLEGMLSHQLKQGQIDGEKTIIQNPSDSQKKEHEKFTFETYEVYAMDVLVSSGDGVGREQDTRVTIYKKTDENYQLKLKASRAFFGEVQKKYSTLPFNLRFFENESQARLGINECVKHKLIEPFQVLYEKPSEVVAQFKFTVLIMPNGPHRITGLPFESDNYKSTLSVTDPELKALLLSSANPKTAKKTAKKKEEKEGGEVPALGGDENVPPPTPAPVGTLEANEGKVEA